MKKKWIYEEINIDIDSSGDSVELFNNLDSEDTIDDTVKILKKIKKDCEKQGFRNIKIIHAVDYESCDFKVCGERLETDEEFSKRQKNTEKKKKASMKKEELKKFMKELNKKYAD